MEVADGRRRYGAKGEMADPRLDRPHSGHPVLVSELVASGTANPLGFLSPLAGVLSHRRCPCLPAEGSFPADPQPRCLCRPLPLLGPGLVAFRADQSPDAKLVLPRRGSLY